MFFWFVFFLPVIQLQPTFRIPVPEDHLSEQYGETATLNYGVPVLQRFHASFFLNVPVFLLMHAQEL